ncbi:cation transporter [Actinotalea sp. K2]|uniref:cation transporter n=1 Tax=Actinotalea sp. K2 TaxID=2939438 RepID=UPI0020176255|nr:heavy metal-associated domain-containing protein [Actinotalea sp. K2]MCL3862883.1 heavy-metal-associated domain-containing protein [Actinotalea sp. K2]
MTGRPTPTTTATPTQTRTAQTLLRSTGFTCPSCVATIEKQLRRVPGVVNATVHFSTGRIEVSHASDTTPEALVAAVARAGYTAHVASI